MKVDKPVVESVVVCKILVSLMILGFLVGQILVGSPIVSPRLQEFVQNIPWPLVGEEHPGGEPDHETSTKADIVQACDDKIHGDNLFYVFRDGLAVGLVLFLVFWTVDTMKISRRGEYVKPQ